MPLAPWGFTTGLSSPGTAATCASSYDQITSGPPAVAYRSQWGRGFFRVRSLFFGSPHEIGLADVVRIVVKTTANSALVESLSPLLNPASWLVALQNGLGNEAFVACRKSLSDGPRA
jgi:Ketopantoate reductase PanE/ApbA